MPKSETISVYIKPEDQKVFEWARQQPRQSLSEIIALALWEYRAIKEKKNG